MLHWLYIAILEGYKAMEDMDDLGTNITANITEEDPGFIPYDQRPETYVVPTVFSIIFIVGALGNGSLILIFLRHRRTGNIPNTYIFSLAIGDLCVIFSCVPFTGTVYTIESWPFGELICKVVEFVKETSIGVSVFTLTIMSIDRYYAIVKPLNHHSKKVTITIAIAIWGISLIFALPSVIFSYIMTIQVGPNKTIEICYPFPAEYETFPKVTVMVKFLVYYTLPLIVISVFYLMMAIHLIRVSMNMPGEAYGFHKQLKGRKKVVKMVLVFVFIFAVCFLPNHVFLLWFYYYPNAMEDYNSFWNTFRIVGFCLSFFNSCINPIALYCVGVNFRPYFNTYLFCCLCPEASKRSTKKPKTPTTNTENTGYNYKRAPRQSNKKIEEIDMKNMRSCQL